MMTKQVEEFYAVSQTFLAYGVRGMLDQINPARHLSSELMYWMLYSAANRGDKRTCMMFLRDWDTGNFKRVSIGRFIPGTHWHVLDQKFNSYTEAKKYIESQGFVVGNVIEHYAPKDGD